MNIYFLIAGIISAMACVGHFTIGRKDYLIPVLKSDAKDIPKKVMHSLFHYMSVALVLSTLVLLDTALNLNYIFKNGNEATTLIGILYAGFALSQFVIALASNISKGVFKLFQWVFWTLIALFTFLG